MESINRWKARAIVGGAEATQLMLARRIGESIIIEMNGTICEVTVCHIANNSVALMVETPEKNLVLRKELVPC